LPNGKFEGDTVEIYKETIMKHGYFEYTPGYQFQLSFGHLAGYGAAYYGYQWALAIARDIASVFKEVGMLDPNTCLRYRQCVLEVGSSVDGKDMVEDFLGRPFSNEAYSKWLAGKD
jgi:thimet oligopeptidase